MITAEQLLEALKKANNEGHESMGMINVETEGVLSFVQFDTVIDLHKAAELINASRLEGVPEFTDPPPLKCFGAARDPDAARFVSVDFDRMLTDKEFRAFNEYIRRFDVIAVAEEPKKDPHPPALRIISASQEGVSATSESTRRLYAFGFNRWPTPEEGAAFLDYVLRFTMPGMTTSRYCVDCNRHFTSDGQACPHCGAVNWRATSGEPTKR